MHVGAGHGNAEQDALKLGRPMQSAALLAAADRVRPISERPLSPAPRRRRRSRTSSRAQPGRRVRPGPPGALGATAPPRSLRCAVAGRPPGRLQQGRPGTPAGRHVHHRREPGLLVQQRGSAALRAGVERRQQRNAKFRQTVRNQQPRQIGTPEETSCGSSHHHVRHPLGPNLRGAPSWSRHVHPVGAQRPDIPMTAGCSRCQPCLSCANNESSSQEPQRRTRGIPRPIQEMISRWISLLPPPNVKITADR